jgi:hypothetical protein
LTLWREGASGLVGGLREERRDKGSHRQSETDTVPLIAPSAEGPGAKRVGYVRKVR